MTDMSVTHLPHAAFWKKKYPPKPKGYISFNVDNTSRPLFQWQIKSLVRWTLTRVLKPRSLFSICLFAHSATDVDDSIQISWSIREHLSHIGLLLLTSLPPSNLFLSKHLSTCYQISLARFCSHCAWTGDSWKMGSHTAKCTQSVSTHHGIETTSVNHSRF